MGTTVPSELADKLALTTRHRSAWSGMITPWNFPVAIPSWKIFPALLAGNGVVIKPSEHAPPCAEAFVVGLVEAGVPAGLVNVVHGTVEPGAALTVHPGVGAVSFTGSVPTGRKVAAAAMATGPRLVSLELGGKNAMVVLPDADLELAADGALFGAFGTCGQRCTIDVAPDRAPRRRRASSVDRIAERAAELRSATPRDPATDVGPVIDAGSAGAHRRDGRPGRRRGREVVTGGRTVDVAGCDGGSFVAADRRSPASAEHHIARDEVFGPVLVGARGRRPRRGRRRRERGRVRPVGRGLHAGHQRRAAAPSSASTPASST